MFITNSHSFLAVEFASPSTSPSVDDGCEKCGNEDALGLRAWFSTAGRTEVKGCVLVVPILPDKGDVVGVTP